VGKYSPLVHKILEGIKMELIDTYKRHNNWTSITRNEGMYNENLKRQERINKMAVEKMEKRVRELMKLGVTYEIAKTMGNKLLYSIKKNIKIVEVVRSAEHRKMERKEITYKEW
jgi:hypothetical protein